MASVHYRCHIVRYRFGPDQDQAATRRPSGGPSIVYRFPNPPPRRLIGA